MGQLYKAFFAILSQIRYATTFVIENVPYLANLARKTPHFEATKVLFMFCFNNAFGRSYLTI